MSQQSRRELVETMRDKYLRAGRPGFAMNCHFRASEWPSRLNQVLTSVAILEDTLICLERPLIVTNKNSPFNGWIVIQEK